MLRMSLRADVDGDSSASWWHLCRIAASDKMWACSRRAWKSWIQFFVADASRALSWRSEEIRTRSGAGSAAPGSVSVAGLRGILSHWNARRSPMVRFSLAVA